MNIECLDFLTFYCAGMEPTYLSSWSTGSGVGSRSRSRLIFVRFGGESDRFRASLEWRMERNGKWLVSSLYSYASQAGGAVPIA